MPSRQKFILIGHAGKDPESRATQRGTNLATFSIAYSEKWKDAGGNWQERLDWFRVTAWGKLADRVVEQVSKGDLVYVEGKIRFGEYTDKFGKQVTTTDVNANDVTILKKKSEESTRGGQQRDNRGGYGGRHEPPPPEDDIPF